MIQSLKEPKDIEVSGKTFIISKFPAVAGREIVFKYPMSAIPKLGDYGVNQETMLKLMSYVAVPRDNGLEPQRLTTQALVDAHVDSFEILIDIEKAMLEYNVSFFRDGRLLNFFESIVQKSQTLTTKISTGLLELLSAATKQPSKN